MALALKYRPQDFSAVVGQPLVVKTLEAMAANLKHHCFLFNGGRGLGKTTASRIFAKALVCQHPTRKPCNECAACRAINNGTAIDILEVDAASNRTLDSVKRIAQVANSKPRLFKYRIIILDEVHMLTNEAFNAMLKLLEEPPAHAVFIMATTEDTLPATIVSRSLVLNFEPLSVDSLVSLLRGICSKEGLYYDEEALRILAISAKGGARDAIQALERVASIDSRISVAATTSVTKRLTPSVCLEYVTQMLNGGIDPKKVTESMSGGISPNNFTDSLIDFLTSLPQKLTDEERMLLAFLVDVSARMATKSLHHLFIPTLMSFTPKRFAGGGTEKAIAVASEAGEKPKPKFFVPEADGDGPNLGDFLK